MNNIDDNNNYICQKCEFPERCKYDNDACERVWKEHYKKYIQKKIGRFGDC